MQVVQTTPSKILSFAKMGEVLTQATKTEGGISVRVDKVGNVHIGTRTFRIRDESVLVKSSRRDASRFALEVFDNDRKDYVFYVPQKPDVFIEWVETLAVGLGDDNFPRMPTTLFTKELYFQ